MQRREDAEETQMNASNFLLWQLADSGFPAGGFAHSAGLEAAMHHGYVRDAATVCAFAQHAVLQAARGALPLATAVHRDPGSLAEMDGLSDVFLSNPVAKRASCAQGRALLSSAARSFPRAPVAPIEDCVRRDDLGAHYAPLFGAIMNALGVEVLDAQRLLLYLAGRGIGSAAVRLGLMGAYEAQELQSLLGPHINRAVERFADLDPLDIAQTAPLADLFQSTHDRLYSRLFQS
jgi:urease accessory protein